MILSAAQLYYICKVYPESITREEAEIEVTWINLPNSDKEYWEASANVVNEMIKK